ncbi:MAG: hypothetical protein AB1716_11625 [Planctomycetota bacterium]
MAAADLPMTTASRTSGVAPLLVHFDAVDVDGWLSGVLQPPNEDFALFYYEWNFDDPGSGNWSTTGYSRNYAIGFVAAHVFENPGHYEVRLTVTTNAGAVHTYVQGIDVEAYAGVTIYADPCAPPGADAQYMPDDFTIVFTDHWAQWKPGAWVGRTVNPDTDQPLQFYITANTRTTLTVLADWSTVSTGVPSLGAAGRPYQLHDYRLAARSPCIDAADNTALPPEITTDLPGRPRFHDDPKTADTGRPGGTGGPAVVDMGAYEFQGASNMAGDLNCDGVIDRADVDPFVLALSDPPGYATHYPNCLRTLADCNGDGRVDFDDITPFVALLTR